MINPETREQITGYLEGFIQGMISAHKKNDLKSFDLRPIRTFSKEGNIKPFHEALIPNGIMLVNEFERSFSTKLGSTFEEVAKLIAKDIHPIVERGCRIRGLISLDTITEIEKIINQLNKEGMKETYPNLIKRVLSTRDEPKIERERIADLYIKDKNNFEFLFEIKSPKPNKGQCLEVIDKLLHFYALKRPSFRKISTFYAMAYNPNGNNKSDYNHSFSKKYLDIDNQVLIGQEFWDFIGGQGTFNEVLEIYRTVGKEKGHTMINQLALD